MKIFDHDIHIWLINLNDNNILQQPYQAILSSQELHKAQQLRSLPWQNQYLISHMALRYILSLYLNCQPNKIPFTFSQYSKPYLIHPENPLSLEFNLSHSQDYALCALSTFKRVGVDIEFIKSVPNQDLIVQEIFTKREKNLYNTLVNARRQQYFYSHWTLKEAFIKAMGEGTSFGFDNIGFDHMENDNFTCDIMPFPHESKEWSARTLTTISGYMAAVATKQKINNIIYHNWTFPN